MFVLLLYTFEVLTRPAMGTLNTTSNSGAMDIWLFEILPKLTVGTLLARSQESDAIHIRFFTFEVLGREPQTEPQSRFIGIRTTFCIF